MVTAAVALLLLGQVGTVSLSQDGGAQKFVRHINCIGPEIVCSATSTFGTIRGAAGAGSGAPTTAQYWTGAADGTLSAEKNLGALSTGLVVNTAGVPTAYAGATCGADNYASATSASGALTCSIPPGTCSGSAAGDVQYNSSGSCGGCTNFECDGTRARVVGETAHPASPGTADTNLLYDWLVTSGFPAIPATRSNAMGLPVPAGLLSAFSLFGTTANWRVTGCVPEGFGSNALIEVGHTSSLVCTSSGSTTHTGPVWATTSLYTRSPVVLSTKTAAGGTNIWSGISYVGTGANRLLSRGINAGEGGFFFWTRVFIVTAPNDGNSVNKMFVGLADTTGLTSSIQPSAYADTVYFGFDAVGGSQQLKFCSNDNVGSSTCHANLGVNFPGATGAWYDLYIWAPPAASAIYGAAVRLDSAQNSGLLTAPSDLPRTSVQLVPSILLGSHGADGGITAMANGGFLAAWNY
jgi:hypothetical protein